MSSGTIGVMAAAVALVALAMVCASHHPAWAHGYNNGTVEVRHPWVLATTDATSRVRMKLTNVSGQSERLLWASTAIAARTTVMPGVAPVATPGIAGGPEKPLPGQAVSLPAGQSVLLAPASQHLLLEGLTRPLAAYDRFDMTLVFERSGTLDIEVMVEEAADD